LLAVDNDPVALDALAQTLRGWGYRVVTATGPDDAQAVMAAHPADALLLDFHLDDGLTGLDVHARLSARFGPRPTLVLTADDGPDTRRQVAEQGLALLRKPVRALALKSVLDRLLAAAQAD